MVLKFLFGLKVWLGFHFVVPFLNVSQVFQQKNTINALTEYYHRIRSLINYLTKPLCVESNGWGGAEMGGVI